MLQYIASFIRNHRGQSVVEFALVAPVLLLILMGIVDFGRVLYQLELVTEAAREAVRAVAATGEVADATTAVAPFSGCSVLAVVPAAPVIASPVAVTVTATVPIYDPLVGVILKPGNTTYPYNYIVTSTANMRVEFITPPPV